MPPTTRRRGASPDSAALDELTQASAGPGWLRKAAPADPVLGAGSTPADEPAATAPRGRRSSSPRSERAPVSTGGKAKVGYYQDPDATARARAAYDWTRPHEGHRSFSDFIAAAVMREVQRLERKYHEGEPWPAVSPRGRARGPAPRTPTARRGVYATACPWRCSPAR